ncbi:MAG: hypothetical protein OJF47_001691 [Nitrospira sp.]|jgi:hypothetical protein|nr:MAG: hypothetical protein OJF47_001691 [Nitrospira sp.]
MTGAVALYTIPPETLQRQSEQAGHRGHAEQDQHLDLEIRLVYNADHAEEPYDN